ncbi:SLC13 family permease [Thalassoglobus sp. JC818]|uniref:SLC13 family permease n=1 Tax=Thalassoglobus sp. JC818 TaxID=3232136 RepID=UPI0034586653
MNESLESPSPDRTRRNWISVAIAILLFVGVICLPTPKGMTAEAHRLAAITVLMATMWLTQPIHIAATSLIPIAAYPFLGILTAKEVSLQYADHNVFLYLGGFAIAVAIERCGLHRRIALHIISRVGSSPRQLVFGFMLTSAILSMWISNTATTMMMLPIALAMLTTLKDALRTSDPEQAKLVGDKLTVPILLGIAYASSIGGLSTFVGTPTNVTFLGFWDQSFVPQGYESLSMAEWMASFVPLSVLMLLATGGVLTIGLPSVKNTEKYGREFFRQQLTDLGRASRTERRVFSVFVMTALLWVLRKPIMFDSYQLLPDWPGICVQLAASLGVDISYLPEYVQDSSIAIAMAMLLFLIPGDVDSNGESQPLLTWTAAEAGLPWGMILLIGSGFAMAQGFEVTQLGDWLGQRFAEQLQGKSPTVIVAGICLMVTFLTEFTTNVATVNTLQPTLAAMAEQLTIDPRLLLIPAAISASCAFMLPIATPPNAIVFGSGRVPITSMVRYGILLNLVGVVLVTLVTTQLASRMMGF